MENGFKAFITMDSNMSEQQDLSAYNIAVLVLRARSNRLQDTRPLMAAVLQALPHAPKGARTMIEA